MRIAVIADTHDRLPKNFFDRLTEADEIWHLGDVTEPSLIDAMRKIGPPVRVVRGNCDSCMDWPLESAFELEGQSILLVHIPPRIAPKGVDLLFHGHTHVPRNEMIGHTRFLNPGCITRPNRGAPASYAWLELVRDMPLRWNLARI